MKDTELLLGFWSTLIISTITGTAGHENFSLLWALFSIIFITIRFYKLINEINK